MRTPRPATHPQRARQLGCWLLLGMLGACRNSSDSVGPETTLSPPEAVIQRAARPADDALTAELALRGYLPFDPLAEVAATATVIEEAGGAAVRPIEGTLVLARIDLALPFGPGTPDLLLLRTFRHHPDLAPDSVHADWDLHHGFGPASGFCRDGAACDAEGRVLRLTHGARVLAVTWQDGHPVSIRDGDIEVVRWQWKGDHLVSISAPTLGRNVVFTTDEAGCITTSAGAVAETWTRSADGRLVAFGPKDEGAAWLHHLTWSEDGRVASIRGPTGETRFERSRNADGTTLVRVVREGQQAASHTIGADGSGRIVTTRGADGQVRATRRFDPAGRLVEAAGPAGTLSAEWDTGGRLVRMHHPSGVAMQLERADNGLLAALVVSGGTVKQRLALAWKDDQVVSISRDDRVLERRTHDARGAVSSITGPDTLEHRFERDARGRISAIIGSDGAEERFTYDAVGRVVGHVRHEPTNAAHGAAGHAPAGDNANAQGLALGWDPQSRLVSARHADGTNESWEWDDNGTLVAHVDAAGRRTRSTHDPLGRVTALDGVDGSDDTCLRFEYGSGSRPSSVAWCRRNGEHLEILGTTRYQWLSDGKLGAITGPDGVIETFTWDAAGRLVAHERGGEVLWRGTWNGPHLAEEQDADGATRRFSYNDLGRVSRIEIRPDRHQRTRVVDIEHGDDGSMVIVDRDSGLRQTLAAARSTAFGPAPETVPVSTLSPVGTAITWTHDRDGRVATSTVAGGDSVRFERDALGRPRRVTSTLGGAVNLAWDAADRLTSLSDEAGHSRIFTWDAAGRLGSVALGEARWQYTHDTHGRLQTLTDAVGRTRRFTYMDAAREPNAIQEAWPDGGSRFERDTLGRVVREIAADGTEITTTWSHFRPESRVAGTDSLKWTWDGAFLMAETGANALVPTHSFAWSTEKDGHVLVERDVLRNTVARTERDAHGRVIVETMTLPNGQEHRIRRNYRADGLLTDISAEGFGAVRFDHDTLGRRSAMHLPEGGVVRWQYDAGGRVANIGVTHKDGVSTWEASFTRDTLGRLAAASVGGDTLSWGYDRQRRLGAMRWTRAGETRVLEHGYDASGALTTIAGQPISRDGGGRVETVGGARRAWDLRGRMSSREDADGRPMTLAWDALGRLVGADGAFGSVRWTVDGRGRLLLRRHEGVARMFHWNGMRLMAESDGQQPLLLHLPGEGPRERLAMRRGTDTWYIVTHPDGSTLALVDGAGHIIESVLHAPHGRLLNRGRALDAWHWRGHYSDPEVGIVQHGMRWLDPDAGVFMSPDPEQGELMFPETLHRFEYLEGDPVNRHDPNGTAGFEWELGKQTLAGVCDLFQKGQVEAGHGFGKVLDGFSYQGAIERRGWVYDVWSKRVPGTDRVVTYIRDLNEKSHGYYGKPNMTGNIVLQPTQPVATTAVQQTSSPTGGGVVQSVRDFMTQVKHGLQLHGREVAGTVAGLGGVSGTLSTPVSVLASLPGGMTIIGIAGAAAAALGYGTGTLVNQLPGVQPLAQGLLSKLFGLEQDQALANLAAAEKNEGEAVKAGRRKRVQKQLEEREQDGLPHEPGEPGVAGGTIGLGPPPGEEPEQEDDDEGEEDDDENSDEKVADSPTPTPGILDIVTPVRVSFTWRQETDASAGEFKNTIICSGRATFWNVGALAPGYEKVEWTGECTTTMSGGKDPIRGSGTFSGGPDGTLKVVNAGETIAIPIVGGRVAVVPEIGECALSPANAFANWPAKLP